MGSLALLAAEQPSPELYLIPTPRQVTLDEGRFAFTAQTEIMLADPNSEEDQFAAQQFMEEASKDLGLDLKTAGVTSKGGILVGRVGNKILDEALASHGVQFPREFPGPFGTNIASQAYALVVASDGVVVAGGGAHGVFFAIQTLKQLLRANRQGTSIPCCRILDWPALPYRCWQNDISRGPIPTLDFLKRQVATLSEFKLNALTLYTENVFKNPRHPKLAPADGLTAEEARELSRYARKYHVEVLGNHQAFGHYEKTLRLPEYAHLRETDAVLTPAKEETYRFLKDVLDVIAPAYESPLFVINCDETFGLGDGPSKSMVKELGLGGVYAYHIQRLARILQTHGKTPLMWGDIALHHRDIVPRLPKDLIVLSWAYDPRPLFDDTIRPFTDMGFRFWVCPGVSSWVWIWPDHQTAMINIANYVRDGARLGAMGMLNTTWGDDGEQLFSYTWQPQVWAAEVSWQPTLPAARAATAKPDADWLRACDAERVRRLSSFDQAFPRLFYGLTNDAVSQAIWKLDALRKTRLANGLNDAVFWQDPLALPPPAPAKAVKEAAQISQEAKAAMAAFSAARQAARFNADALDFAAFAARRVAFLGARANSRLATARSWAETAGQKDKALAVLKGSILDSRVSLRNEVRELRQEYARLWALENRSFWLDQVLARYDALAGQLDNANSRILKAASLLDSESAWPDPESLRLDLPGSAGRKTTPKLADGDLGLSAAAWALPKAIQRMPVLWEAKNDAPRDPLLEVVLPRKSAPALQQTGSSFALTELQPDGLQQIVPAQCDLLPDGSVRLLTIISEAASPSRARRFLLYTGPAGDLGSPSVVGAVTARTDGKGGCWVENDRYRAHLMPEGAHIYAFHVKQASDLDVTAPGQTDWHGFSDVGSSGRSEPYTLSLEASGPLLVRIRCASTTGVEKVLNFRAGAGWYECLLEQAVGYYWDFDDTSVMGSQSKTPGQAAFSDGHSATLPRPAEVSHGREGTQWGLKRRPDGLTLGLITPGAACTHRVGPGDSMGGVGIEGSGQARHFVTLCDVIPSDPAVLCSTLAKSLDLRNQAIVTVGAAQVRK